MSKIIARLCLEFITLLYLGPHVNIESVRRDTLAFCRSKQFYSSKDYIRFLYSD